MPGESKPQWAVRHFGRRQTLPGVGSWSRHKTMQDIFSECRPCGETAGCKSTWCHTWVDSGHIACLLSRIVRFAKSKRRKPRTLTKWSGLPVGAQCALQKNTVVASHETNLVSTSLQLLAGSINANQGWKLKYKAPTHNELWSGAYALHMKKLNVRLPELERLEKERSVLTDTNLTERTHLQLTTYGVNWHTAIVALNRKRWKEQTSSPFDPPVMIRQWRRLYWLPSSRSKISKMQRKTHKMQKDCFKKQKRN